MTSKEGLQELEKQISELKKRRMVLKEEIRKSILPELKTITHKFFYDTEVNILHATKDISDENNAVDCLSIFEETNWCSKTLDKVFRIKREKFDIEDFSDDQIEELTKEEFIEKLDSVLIKYRNEILS